MQSSRLRAVAQGIIAGIASAATACGSVSPALRPADPAPPPYADSAFATCTVFVFDSGKPGRTLQQGEFTISENTEGTCPPSLILTNPSNEASWVVHDGSRYPFNLTSSNATSCVYVNPQFAEDTSVMCKLAPPKAAPAASASSSVAP